MAFCCGGTYNACVTASIPKKLVGKFKHWLGVMSDEEYAKWLNEPDQKKLWRGVAGEKGSPGENPSHGPTPIRTPLVYDPSVAELPPDMMFMHDAVFTEGEEVPDVDLKFPEYEANWWYETEADRNITSRGRVKDRVDKYLDESEKTEYAWLSC